MHGLMAYPDSDRSDLAPEQSEVLEWAEDETQKAVEANGFEHAVLHNELRLWYTDEKAKPVFSGQADRIYIVGRRAYAPDYKFGRLKVEGAGKNLQMRSIALLVFENYDVDEVIVQIIQPRLYFAEAAIYTKADVVRTEANILGYVNAANLPDADRVPSYSACHYCKGKTICPEYNHIASQFVTVMPSDLKDPMALAFALDRAHMLKPLIAAIEGEAKDRLAEGEDLPGWTLGKARTIRKITDTELAMQRLLDLPGVTTETILAIMKLGFGDIDKVVAKAKTLKGKALKEAVSKLLDGLVEEKESAAPLKKL